MPSLRIFIPCLVDQVSPEIGISMVRVLTHFGYEIVYSRDQICCGQPAYNSGYVDKAARVARRVLDVFDDELEVVCPSGSCTAMLRKFLPELFENSTERDHAVALGKRVFEFSEFLCNKGHVESLVGAFAGRVAFHNSCHSLRELGIHDGVVAIVKKLAPMTVPVEAVCCGFGGLFSATFPEIAKSMAQDRLSAFCESDIETVVSNDPGCIMHLKSIAESMNVGMRFLHITEFIDESIHS